MPQFQIALKTALVLVDNLHHQVHLQMWKWFDDKSIKTIKIQESFLKLLLRGHLYLWQPLKNVITFIFNVQTNHEACKFSSPLSVQSNFVTT